MPAIDAWKEILSEPRNQQERRYADQNENGSKEPPAVDQHGEQELIRKAKLFETSLERLLYYRKRIAGAL